MLLRDLIVLDSFCMKGQGTAVKFAFMKIVLCTVAFFILFSSILEKYLSFSGPEESRIRTLPGGWGCIQLKGFLWDIVSTVLCVIVRAIEIYLFEGHKDLFQGVVLGNLVMNNCGSFLTKV